MPTEKELLLFLLIVSSITTVYSNLTFSQWLEIVTNGIEASEDYVIPLDNSALLEVTNPKVKDYGTYDFIVIGSGAAGAIVANRLTEISDWNVLLLEAGGEDNDFTKIIGLYGYLYHSPLNWGFNTTSQNHACLGMINRECRLAHGKVIGGSTTINAATYARGNPEDYNRWAEVYGNEGWSFSEVLPYFKKTEKVLFEPNNPVYRGQSGNLPISIVEEQTPYDAAVINGFQEIGLPHINDYNTPAQNGIAKMQLIMKGNERVSVATAFLKGYTQRRNLKISLNSFVTKILIDKSTKRAYGVEFVKNGTTFVANASKEVVLSAGGYNSPQILMLSGIGPKEHLQELNIPVIQDSPVGKTYIDHTTFLGFGVRFNRTIYNYTIEESLERYLNNLTPWISSMTLAAYTNFDNDQSKRPEIEYIFAAPRGTGYDLQSTFIVNDAYANAFGANTTSDVWVAMLGIHPISRGSLTLKSNNPKDKPVIDPQMLINEQDVETLYRGVQYLLQLNRTQAFKQNGAEIVVAGSPSCSHHKYLSRDWWICTIHYLTAPAYHPVAVTAMGTNRSTSVVNPRLQVYGIKGLRVANEGVAPEPISGHNMAPSMLIGEKVSDFIKEDYGRL